jgi:hypothetical protein
MTTSDDRSQPGEAGWESGWDGHAASQARYMAGLPFLERLKWLEEAHALAITLLGQVGFERARDARIHPDKS